MTLDLGLPPSNERGVRCRLGPFSMCLNTKGYGMTWASLWALAGKVAPPAPCPDRRFESFRLMLEDPGTDRGSVARGWKPPRRKKRIFRLGPARTLLATLGSCPGHSNENCQLLFQQRLMWCNGQHMELRLNWPIRQARRVCVFILDSWVFFRQLFATTTTMFLFDLPSLNFKDLVQFRTESFFFLSFFPPFVTAGTF